MSDRVAVRNASDPQQVRRAERTEHNRADVARANLRAVMATPYGRAVLWDLLSACGVYESIFNPNGSLMYYNTGRQDFGHQLRARLLDADEALYDVMTQEARARAKREHQLTDAAQLAAATQTEE